MTSEIKKIISEIPKTMEFIKTSENEDEWTHEIKNRFWQLGKEYSYYVCTTKSNIIQSDCGEWLYDLCWLDFDKNSKSDYDYMYLKEIILALESELGNADKIIDDFHKLLQSKAKYKIMIFQIQNYDRMFKYMENNIKLHWNTENRDKYILACYNNKENEFKIKII